MKHLEKPERRAERVEEVYSVLALVPWSSPASDRQLEVLCEALWAARDGPLNEERVLGALLRPRCDTLVSVYCSTSVRLQRDHLLRNAPETQVDLPEAEKLTLSLCCHKNRRSAWKAIFFECLSSGKHFLEQVLATALDLVKHEEFNQLKALLQLEFRPLSRLLLLLGWSQCRSLDSAQLLLRTLHTEQVSANDRVLQDFCNLLSSQLGVLEWCKSNNPGLSTKVLLAQLQTLGSHSALYLLHTLTPLTRYEEHRILDLLQQLPDSPRAEETDAVSGSAGVQKNVVLFRGFCAMKYAIYALCVNVHKYSNCTECESVQHHQPAETDQNKSSVSSEGGRILFQHYLSECQLFLETVPAMFRLELLENIFSLLFLSTSDFVQQVQKDSSTDTDAHSECTSNAADQNVEAEAKVDPDETEQKRREDQKQCPRSAAAHSGHLDLEHLVQGCRGFLVDVTAMEGFLKLLKEGLEGMCVVGRQEGQETGRALSREAEAAAVLGCSVTAETFGARLQRLSKHTAEAQWRLQIITSNQGTGDGSEGPIQMSTFSSTGTPLGHRKNSGSRRRRKPVRHAAERQTSIEKHNGDVSTSASEQAEVGTMWAEVGTMWA
ncbi:zinc finger FYVE domain-containing protein 26 [Nematolebias whitei]|uniref:zinc finger FYVE domain-containing protein 26 n=1 Tax=Nematolebias whitei TaxID=451745 RepID=UPI00189708B9|nr:zinc finger FYVE domain-containing protein 26 [Nematolebias whitei]